MSWGAKGYSNYTSNVVFTQDFGKCLSIRSDEMNYNTLIQGKSEQ